MKTTAPLDTGLPPVEFDSESGPTKPPRKSLQLRRRLFVIISIVALGSTTAIISVILYDSRDSVYSQSFTAHQVVDEDPVPSIGTTNENSATQSDVLLVGSVENYPIAQNSITKSEVDYQSLEFETVQSLLENVEHQLQQNNDAHHYLGERLDAVNELEEKVASLIKTETVMAEMIEERLLSLERLSTMLAESRKSIQAGQSNPSSEFEQIEETNLPMRPPFRLISIDQWQNRWNAVLELDGKVSMIESNSSRADWRLLNINPVSKTATFQHKNGAITTLSVSS